MQNLQKIIENTFEKIDNIDPTSIDSDTRKIIEYIIISLDNGTFRVAEKVDGNWITHKWLKKAILLYFLISKNKVININKNSFYDKIPLKFSGWDENRFQNAGIRIVPPASVRYGAYISFNTVLMPSYINIGAYIDKGTMIDTWATVGSCAQIGKNVHLSGGVGIGGVLEPMQSNPTIIEDNCFIGARSEIVEGVIVEEHSVISMGVFIGKSTKIYDREKNKIYYGRVPAGSVVVSGSLPSIDRSYNLYSAIIVKRVDEKTRSKISINKLLRTIN